MERVSRFLIAAFGLVGVATLTLSAWLVLSELDFRREAVLTTGTVVDLDYSRRASRPVVDYADRNGVKHRVIGRVGSTPPALDRGERVDVRYRSEDPDNAHIGSFVESWLGATLLGAVGLVFGGIAAGFVLFAIRKRRLRAWLETHGMRVQAQCTGVALDRSLRVNGRYPWRIHAQWQHPVTQELHEFASDALWSDPTPYVTRETLDVKVDADDPRRYHMDISFLPRAS